ncbi:amidohydrolase [Microbacterium sp. A204]|uniref:amidohydrolase n=1 Tax=Microbacterium sp. A204 TaxID=3457321 RepID=UPI003FD0DB3A
MDPKIHHMDPIRENRPSEWQLIIGDIVTMDSNSPRAEAMAVDHAGHLRAVGSLEDVRAACPEHVRTRKVTGCVAPGFIDSHFYMQRAGIKLMDRFPDAQPRLDEYLRVMEATSGDPDWAGGIAPRAVRAEGLRRVQPLLHAVGITGVTDPWSTPETMREYQRARRNGELTMRVTAMAYVEELRDHGVTVDEVLHGLAGLGVSTGFGDDFLRIGAFKIYVDGEGRRQQALREQDWPETGDRGVQAIEIADLIRIAEFCVVNDWSLAVHAIGGRAMRLALEAFEEVATRLPELRERRFRIIHAYLEPDDATMRRARQLGVLVSSQPAIQWANGAWLEQMLPESGATANPLRRWLDAGVRVVVGSDGPYFPFEPLRLMWFARTRAARSLERPLGESQRLDPQEALRSLTIDAAYLAGVEDSRGSLQAGKLADWVELSADPTSISDSELLGCRVTRTVIGGETVFALKDDR